MRYEDASGTFQASGPVANDDSDTLAAGSRGPAIGNLITGEGTQYGSSGADSAAGGHITSIGGKGGEDSSFAGGKLTVSGEFGQLSVDAKGDYSYLANKGAPENVRDRFTYTLADNQGNTDTAALIVEIGKTPVVIKANAQQIVPGPDGVVTLPPGVELSDIMVVGRNLVINMPDGTQLIIVDGAVFVPQLEMGGVEVPASNLAALLIGQEPHPAAGETPPSSGGNFALPPPPLDPGVPLGDLLPPTELHYIPPEPQPTFPIENKLLVNFGNIDILIDDDTLPGGLAGGPGDGPDGVNIHGFLSALALSQIGGNGPLTFSLSLTTAPTGFALVSGGPGIALLQQNGVTVRTITFDPATGEYDVTQNARIQHPGGGEENNLVFVLTVTATDQDGDTAQGTITVTYNDDTPEATQLQVGGTVDEDGVPGGVAGGPDDVAGEITVVNGSVVGLFLPGADGPLTFGLSGNTSGLPALTSHGVAVTYAVAGDTLTASAGGSTVFTLVVHADGSYTFTLVDQLDHPSLNGQPGDNAENDLSLALGSVVQATDQDGDSVTAPPTGLVIVVDDDTPVALQGSSSGTVDEDGVPGGIAGGVDDVAGAATVANGSIASLFASGADAPLTFNLLGDTSGLPALTSGGDAVTYAVAGNTLTASAGGHTVFTLVLNSDGSWTFTLVDQLDHAAGLDENDLTIDLSSILQATDADGDSVGAGPRALLITVDDDTPTASANHVTGLVDEDGVVEGVADGGEGDGIAGGVGDVAGQATVANGSAVTMFNSGADAPLSFGFAANAITVLEALGLTSNGVALDYAIVGDTITASTAAGDVFTFELNANGNWEFTLIDQLDHAQGNNENDLTINLGNIVEASDADGDSVVGNADGLVITVDDDTPTASGAQVTGLVDEDGVVEGAPDGGQGDGIPGGVGDVPGEPTVAAGSVVTMFNSGADAPLSYGFAANAVAVLGALGLTSGGVALDYAIVGDTVTASTAAGDVFTFELNANGSWEFTLIDQLDHATDNNENDLQIQLGAIIQATDADGDSVVGNANGLVITVDDDTPGQGGEPSTIFVDEDATTDGNPGGPADGPGTGNNGSIFLSSQFSSGADEPFSYGMSTDTSGLPALTSNGVAIQYQVVGSLLTAAAGGNPIFTVALDPVTGEVTFTLIDQIDHATLNGQPGDNTENNLQIDLSSLFTATDADGDSISLDAGSVIVDVDDDTPIALEAQVTGIVDEDGVVEGAADGGVGDGIAGGVGDVAGENTVATGSVLTLFSGGADQPLSFGFTANAVVLLEGLGLTSNGLALDYAIVGNTVTASTSAGDVFTFQLTSGGNWTFTLVDQLDHAEGNNENDLTIQLGSIIQATDADGDSVTAFAGGLVITVDDDTPTASAAQVTGLVDEDGVREGASDGGPGDGIAGGIGDVAGTDTVATGSVATMFNTGADAPLSYGFAANAVTVLQGLGLTSNHIALSYVVNGDTITASTAAGDVFTFQLTAGGNWTFTLIDQLDHPTLNNLPGDDTENDLAINLGAIVQATDADGDSVVGNANGLVVTVDDDTPTAANDLDLIVGGNGPATGNVITGVDIIGGDANGTDGAVDHTGADAPVSITAIASVNVPGNVDTDPSANFIIAGAHGTLTLNANGDYSYLRTDNVGGVQDVFTYTLTDADGDSVTATLTISIEDNFPEAGNVEVQIDDDDVLGAGGNPNGVGDDDPSGATGFLIGTGGDTPRTFSLLATGAPSGFSYVLQPDGSLHVLQGGNHVVTITITDTATGAYSVTQVDNIIHADGLNENNVDFTVNYRVTDFDGDHADGTIHVDVDDDTPVLSNVLAGVGVDVDETDAVNPGGFPISDTSLSAVITATQSFGADGAALSGSVVYGLAIPGGSPQLTTLKTAVGDFAITLVAIDSDTLQGQYQNGGTQVAFTVQMNSNGTVTLTQNVALEHNTDGGPGAAHNDTLDLSGLVNATITIKDGDNDTASAATPIGGNLVFFDDGPDANLSGQAVGSVTLDETRAEGTDTVGGTAPTGDQSATINFALNFVNGVNVDYGADGAGTTVYSFSLSGSNVASGLFALDNTDIETVIDGFGKGSEIVLNLSGNVITGSVGVTNYFTLTINPATGVVTFEQLNNIWHPTAGSSAAALDDTATLNTALATNIQVVQTVTDSDGDFDTASINVGQGVFKIQDDGPRFGPDVDSLLQILNDATPTNTGDLDITIGTDSPNGGTGNQIPDDLSVSGFTVDVNGSPASNVILTAGAENATTANYTFSFQYDTGSGGLATANGTLVFDKGAGTYTVSLTNGPIEGFSLLSTGSADASDFVSYQVPVGGSGAPEVTVAALDTDFFVQFSGVAEPGSGTGANNLFTTQGTAGSFDPVTTANFANLELFTQAMSTIQVSSSAAGVAGNTIQGGEVLDLNLYETDPAGTLGGVPTQSSTSMFIVLDGIGGAEDMIVVLKLFDTVTGQYTTKAMMVQNADIITSNATLAGTPYAGIVLDNNDGIVVFEENDYQAGNANLVIVGAQIAGSDEGITGTATNLNGALGAGGGSSGTQAFSTDVSDAPFKITSIGFLTTSTEDQTATIDFDVTIHDADGDTALQHITVEIGDTQSLALPAGVTSFAAESSGGDGSISNLSFSSNDNGKWNGPGNDKGFGNVGNTGITAGIVAAAGLQSTAAAAQPTFEHSFDVSLQGVAQDFSLKTYNVQSIDDGALNVQSLGPVTSEPAFDMSALQGSGHSFSDIVEAHGSLDVQSLINAAPAYQPNFSADQAPAIDASMLVATVAPTVGMPSAEMLQAVTNVAGVQHGGAVEQVIADAVSGVQQGGAVEQVLAEALGHNNAPTVDGLLQGLPGGGASGEMSAILNGSSANVGAVSGWDMGVHGAFGPTADMLFKMDVSTFHHDAVQPAVNG